MQAEARHFVTPEEYLTLDRASEARHEYFEGEVFAMSGGTLEHGLIATNLAALLSMALRHQPCVALGSDTRLHIPTNGLYTYPDAMVIVGGVEFLDSRRDTVTNPRLVVEVLSDSTEAYDRGDKFALYRSIPSLQEYLLVSQRSARVERFFKNERGHWELVEAAGWDSSIDITAIGQSIALRDLYAKVEGIDPATAKTLGGPGAG